MAFFRKKKTRATRTAVVERPGPKKRIVVPVEMKVLASEAFEAGLSAGEIAEIIGAAKATVSAWAKQYREEGVDAFLKSPSNTRARKYCDELRLRIEGMRKENPEAGVRRIRDELRREEAIEVSAEGF
ncbi:MAG: helix-turn-helix domain-containing protein [Deltaproteobacteria bacterium]|nr:helix-turn-helix domain-containing protein [Deltaproteobacteria bacterium]